MSQIDWSNEIYPLIFAAVWAVGVQIFAAGNPVYAKLLFSAINFYGAWALTRT